MTNSPRPILIAGGGIGGLATALALARRGIPTHILERNKNWTEAGAGIQIGPNGMRVLDALGVSALLEPCAGKPNALLVVDGLSGRELTRLPLGHWIEARHGAPYWVAHRADLQAVLLACVRSDDAILTTSGFEAADFEETDAGIDLTAVSGEKAEGAALIGADGLWSTVRQHIAPSHLTYAGRTAARTVIEAADARTPFRESVVGLWLSPDAHVVHYPIKGGAQTAVVAVVREEHHCDGWSAPADRTALLARLDGFSTQLTDFLALSGEWRKWTLFDAAPLTSWSRGCVALIGDAAHPVLPFLAQGGVMALEDAVTIADCIARAPGDLSAAFQDFERIRRPRIARVQRASRRNGIAYHLGGPLAGARNQMLRWAGPERLMASLNWLYGWRLQSGA